MGRWWGDVRAAEKCVLRFLPAEGREDQDPTPEISIVYTCVALMTKTVDPTHAVDCTVFGFGWRLEDIG